MKYFWILFTIIMLFQPKLSAQLYPAFDANWVFSSSLAGGPNYPIYWASLVDFKTSPPTITSFQNTFGTLSSAVLSDASGNLAFYSNLCAIMNNTHNIMQNGDQVNAGWFNDSYCSDGGSYPITQGGLILPFADWELSNKYRLFSIWLDKNDKKKDRLLYSVVNMNMDNGKGSVTEKDVPIDIGPFANNITAVQHANGRDWWVITPMDSVGYRRFLVTPQGTSFDGYQDIGLPWNAAYWSGQTCFSPDGNKYARLSPYNGINIFDFDRCTGLLSNPLRITLPQERDVTGGCFSPTSQYLYVSMVDTLYQFDVTASDIPASRTVVGILQEILDPNFPTAFYQCQLALDGKMYINATNGVRNLHILHEPNLPGLASQIEIRALHLPAYTYLGMNNQPFYRTGPVDGSICDSLGLNNIPQAWFRHKTDSLDELQVHFTDLTAYYPSQWFWDFGDGSSSTEQNPTHEYDSTGVYPVCLHVSNTSGADSVCQTLYVGVTAIPNPENVAAVSVLGNPVTTHIQIVYNGLYPHAQFLLYDLNGIVVRMLTLQFGVNTMDIDDLPNGFYFYVAGAGGRRLKEGKIVKIGY